MSNHHLKGSVLTIGNFDGVHVGHVQLIQKVIKTAKEIKAPAILYTFDPHPHRYLFPDKEHKLLCSVFQKKTILKKWNLDHIIIQTFDKVFSALSPEEFIKQSILNCLFPRYIVVGYNFRFGFKGKGSIDLLKRMGEIYQFKVKVVEPVKIQNQVVSSTAVKKLILSGDWDLVRAFLGRPFSLRGKVVSGAGRGRLLGFPTVNLSIDEQILIPKNGVYVARMKSQFRNYKSVLNIGTNPTFSKDNQQKIEVHIIDGFVKWTDKTGEVEILDYLRPERKFKNKETLVQFINSDIQQAHRYFAHFL